MLVSLQRPLLTKVNIVLVGGGEIPASQKGIGEWFWT